MGISAAASAKAALARIGEGLSESPPPSLTGRGWRALRRQGESVKGGKPVSSLSFLKSWSRVESSSKSGKPVCGQPIGEGHEVTVDRGKGESDADLSLPGALALMARRLDAKRADVISPLDPSTHMRPSEVDSQQVGTC